MIRALLLAALIASPAAARDVFVDSLAGYVIEPDILAAPNCSGPAFAGTLESFEKGLCLFHRPARSPADTEAALAALGAAQTLGLPPVHQQLATLVSGLAHCSGAERHLDAFRASGNQSLIERTFFCRDRRLAQSELNAMRWNHALFDYAEGQGATRTLDARLGEMGSCQAGVLNAGFDAECGLLTNLSETEIDAFVDEAVDEVIEVYFEGVESPITAMFSRKLGRAEGLLGSAEAGIADLAAGAAAVNGEHEAIERVYVAARDGKMGPIYDAYREAILRVTAILDEFDRWKGGLFITVENVNLLPKITERATDVADELARVEELAFADKAAALAADVARVVGGEAETSATVAELCRVYFCELTSARAMPNLIRACRRPALAGSPLCVGQDGQIAGGTLAVEFEGPQSVEIGALCRGAGVDPAFTQVNLDPATAATCLGAMP